MSPWPRAAKDTEEGTATVSILADADSRRVRGAATVAYEGSENLVPFVPGAYLDKLLIILGSGRGREAKELLAEIEEDLLVDQKTASEIPIIPAEQAVGMSPYAVITVRAVVLYDKDRFGAYTWFGPKKVVREPGTCITAYYLLRTWVSQRSGDQGASLMFESLRAQVAHYRAERPPKVRDLGKAPFVALNRTQERQPQPGAGVTDEKPP